MCEVSDAFEATMEIMPSKFRSPPPKPPRRRHSDQLTISPSGTYPSSRKKHYDESKLCSKETQRKVGNSIGCGSLPTNWVPDFSTETKNENSVLSSSTSLSSTYVKNACVNFQMCSSSASDKDSNGLTDIMMEVDSKSKELFECVQKKELPYLGQVTRSGIFAENCNSRDFFEYLCNDIQHTSDVRDMLNDSPEHKSIPKYDHRRHHSDPLLSYPDGSNSKSSLQIYVPKSHSVLENISLDNQNRLCNSFSASFELKETQNLYEEIKNLKEVNNKLWQHLCSTQACLEKVTKNAEENVNSLSVSDLLSSLYCSQKARDCAMEDRMRIILEERDAAIQELENMVQIIARSFKDDAIEKEEKFSDKEIKDLLKEIEVTYNPSKLLQQQRLLLTYLYRSKELKQDYLRHELKLAVSENNHLKEKMKLLEEELKSMKICNELWNADNKHWENNLLNILCQVIQQRDVALSKVNHVQNLEHVDHSRPNKESSRIIEPLIDDYESLQKKSDNLVGNVKRNFQSSHSDACKYDQLSIEPMSDEIRLLKGEILVLNKALEMEIEKRENAEEKCLRLERLVSVLQRKVNGQNVGISV